jgi:hypothetical protein
MAATASPEPVVVVARAALVAAVLQLMEMVEREETVGPGSM